MTSTDAPRHIIDAELPPDAGLPEVVRWAVAHAALAPSELNTQPWRFRADTSGNARAVVELHLDTTRLLPTVDPQAREAVLSCGAALLNLRLSLQGAALGTSVRLLPDPTRPDLLAEVLVEGPATEPDGDRALRLAIPLRGTHRAAFEPVGVPAELVDQLAAEVVHEGSPVAVLDQDSRRRLLELNQQARRRLWLGVPYRREVARWSRGNSGGRPDGVPGFAVGLGAWASWLEARRIRAGSRSAGAAADQQQLVEQSPVLVVVGAAGDGRPALLRAGAGMQRLLLRAQTLDLAASYVNAALHVPGLRRALAEAIDLDFPQVVLRIGYAERPASTPRRPEASFLELHRH